MQATLHLPTLHFPTLRSASHAPSGQPAPSAQGQQPAVESQALLQGQKAVTIHHNGALYRLQATKLGKLILTK